MVTIINDLFGNTLYLFLPVIIIVLLFLVSIHRKRDNHLAFFVCVAILISFVIIFAFYVGANNSVSLKINAYEFNLPVIITFLIVLWTISVIYSRIMDIISNYVSSVIDEVQEHQEYVIALEEKDKEKNREIEELHRKKDEHRESMSFAARALSKK